MDDKQLAKLIKKTMAKAEQKGSKVRPKRAYDATLPPRPQDEGEAEAEQIFDEMKRREF